MNVLVTGSSGFIGPHLVEALKSRGDYVIGLDRVRPSTIEPHVFVHGDLLGDDALKKAMTHDIQCVAHLAAARADWGLSDEEYERDNATATERIIAAGRAAGVKKWLHYSTVGVLGSGKSPLDDLAPIAPVGPYGTSKARAEALFAQLAASDPLAEVTMIRPSAVFGPGNPSNTNVYRLIDAIHHNRFVMIGTGENVKTVSYLPNLIEATLFLIDAMAPGMRPYIYVDTPALTTRELVTQLYEALGKPPSRWHLPLAVARPVALPFDALARLFGTDLPITSARIEKFCRWTNFDRSFLDKAGFTPSIPIEDALRDTVRWYLNLEQAGR